jgi:hypothetical protein
VEKGNFVLVGVSRLSYAGWNSESARTGLTLMLKILTDVFPSV